MQSHLNADEICTFFLKLFFFLFYKALKPNVFLSMIVLLHVYLPCCSSPDLLKSAALGETVSLSCSASKGVDDDLSWYLQKPGQPPKLLFYKISSRQSDTPSHFSSSGSEPQFTLTIGGVQAEDTGDYYCMGAYIGLRTQCYKAVQKPPTDQTSGWKETDMMHHCLQEQSLTHTCKHTHRQLCPR
uniref:Ig-like domain-containing protein n=1 Tax=Xiphophorus couchianus TaxID=32473 RepID=A0A3B5M643_9TELE